jgi:menaquinone-dependent protoporphyrinogen oxidase
VSAVTPGGLDFIFTPGIRTKRSNDQAAAYHAVGGILEPMKPVAVIYATRKGHTGRIADAVSRGLRRKGLQTNIIDLGRMPSPEDLDRYGAVVLASPVHMGQYAREVIAFVKHHRSQLDRMMSAFVSVTLSDAGREWSDATPEQHKKFLAYVRRVNERFFEQTGWHPGRIKHVAGALVYTRYNFLIRLLMKRIARKSGGSADTSRDHDHSDWVALDRFVDAFANDILADALGKPSAGQLSE